MNQYIDCEVIHIQKVAVVKADSYDPQVVNCLWHNEIDQAMQELLAPLGGMSQFIQPGDRVLVKPNMLEAADKASGITTHLEVVRALYGK